VTAQATDTGGAVGTAQVGITVNSCKVVATLTPPSALRLPQVITTRASGNPDGLFGYSQNDLN
jgi:hypothetical protein